MGDEKPAIVMANRERESRAFDSRCRFRRQRRWFFFLFFFFASIQPRGLVFFPLFSNSPSASSPKSILFFVSREGPFPQITKFPSDFLQQKP
ncbi:unnamed protein product [Arabidopsis halleri]